MDKGVTKGVVEEGVKEEYKEKEKLHNVWEEEMKKKEDWVETVDKEAEKNNVLEVMTKRRILIKLNCIILYSVLLNSMLV